MANPAKQGLKRQKLLDLDLKVLKEEQQVVSGKKPCFCSSKLELPVDLPSVEETLQVLAAALKAFSFLESLALEPEKGKGLRKLLRF